MQPLATLVPAFKAIEIGVEPMCNDYQGEGYMSTLVGSLVIFLLLRDIVCLKLKGDI